MSRIIITIVAAGILTTSHATEAGENSSSFFLKLPITSFHVGDDGGYTFNQRNFGVGIGYEHIQHVPEIGELAVAYSVSRFVDSYHCTATNIQVRALRERGPVAVGISMNLAHKCVKPHTRSRTFIAPLLTSALNLTESVRVTLDGFPPVSKRHGVGFIGVSLDIDFK